MTYYLPAASVPGVAAGVEPPPENTLEIAATAAANAACFSRFKRKAFINVFLSE
jgi:hypothetical protein